MSSPSEASRARSWSEVKAELGLSEEAIEAGRLELVAEIAAYVRAHPDDTEAAETLARISPEHLA